jgi:hypothetical protein
MGKNDRVDHWFPIDRKNAVFSTIKILPTSPSYEWVIGRLSDFSGRQSEPGWGDFHLYKGSGSPAVSEIDTVPDRIASHPLRLRDWIS